MKRTSPSYRTAKSRLDGVSIVTLGVLLLAPVWALAQLSLGGREWGWAVVMPVAISVFTFFAYRSDKRCAESGQWRIPETTLHVMALLGGWPGAFVAQRVFRHKTSKLSFQAVFWGVVALHQFLAIDWLLSWRLTGYAFRFVQFHAG